MFAMDAIYGNIGPNLHTVYMADQPMCVECPGCGRRAVYDLLELKRWATQGNMTTLSSIARRMRCQECGKKGMRWFLPVQEFRMGLSHPSNSA